MYRKLGARRRDNEKSDMVFCGPIDNDRCFSSAKVRFNFKVFAQCLLKSFNLLKYIAVDLSIGEELGDFLHFVFTWKGSTNQWMYKQMS